MINKSNLKWLLGLVFATSLLYFSFYLGRRTERRITWMSELMEKIQGRKQNLIEVPLVCSNGKKLGMLMIDVNLRNGKWRIVRNDAGLEPNCDVK
jgi:hypothetical protein